MVARDRPSYAEFALRPSYAFVVLDAGEVVKAGGREELTDENVRRLLVV
jgi:hypothetical protein